jgi:hypothetical protein
LLTAGSRPRCGPGENPGNGQDEASMGGGAFWASVTVPSRSLLHEARAGNRRGAGT